MTGSPTTTDAQSEIADAAGSVRPSRAVVEAVAEAEGVDEVDLDPLYHAIDPDELDALFQPRSGAVGAPDVSGEITFTYHGYEVRTTASGRVELTER